jgi:AcrR family transcriptional regulator
MAAAMPRMRPLVPITPPGESPEFPDELARLPRGRHGLPQEFVEHNQRQRLLASFTHLLGDVGYNEATITATAAGAGISTVTFYQHFETIEDVYLAALEETLSRLAPILLEAFESEGEWPAAVRATLAALLDLLAADPDMARLLTAEPFVAGATLAERYRAAFDHAAPYLARGRELRDPKAEPLPETTERSLLGAAGSLIGRHAFSGEAEALPGLLPDLTQFILTPYLGPVQARRVALDAG